MKQTPVFDSHLHIIDPRFPLVANAGFLPDAFTVEDYLERTLDLGVVGGAVVSGSFQAFDQSYLEAALARLGPSFVGVTQLPEQTSEREILRLDALGVRALRLNLRRGVYADAGSMVRLARRAFDTAGWHAELYLDSTDLPALAGLLKGLPRMCVDHLGLSRRGLPHLLRLVERGAWVKATGFGRLDFPPAEALSAIARVAPEALLFGTDLPCTRAPRPFAATDIQMIEDALAEETLIRKVLRENAVRLYRRASLAPER
jgi:predicted TIM-barrel fold metal-dependent hydrolase